MTARQRLGFLVVALVILVVAVVSLAGGEDDGASEQASQTTATPTATPTPEPTASGEVAEEEPTATPEPTPEPTPDPGPILTAAKVTEITVKKGERVRFRARSAEADEVHVHGYDHSKDVPAGKTIEMSFKADIEGIFEIELEHAGKPIGELRVNPR